MPVPQETVLVPHGSIPVEQDSFPVPPDLTRVVHDSVCVAQDSAHEAQQSDFVARSFKFCTTRISDSRTNACGTTYDESETTNYSLRTVPTILEHAMEVEAVRVLSWE